MGFALAKYLFARSSDDSVDARRETRRPVIVSPQRPLSLTPDDAALVARVRAGERDAFAVLMTTYYPSLAVFVHRYVGSHDAADDVLQELFVKIWERRDGWEVHGSLRAYLFVAARNSALHARARLSARRRAEARGGTDAMDDVESFDVEDALAQNDLANAVRKVVTALPERCREIFQLSREHGLSYSEIANVLGISVSTVKTQMGRAMVALEERVARFRE